MSIDLLRVPAAAVIVTMAACALLAMSVWLVMAHRATRRNGVKDLHPSSDTRWWR